MKKKTLCALAIALIILSVIASPLFAESVFLKDGSIIEGTVTSETPNALTVTMPNKVKTEIPLTEIVRVLENSDYKKPATIRKKDGTEMVIYIVEERSDAYIARTVLASPNEISIPKQDIREFVGKRPLVTLRSGDRRTYTPKEAATTSLIPIRSGSLLVGKDALGIGLVFAKTGTLLFPVALIIGSAFGSPGVNDSPNDSSGSYSPMEDENMRRYTMISLGAWVLLTATDMIYSYHRVKNFNERAGAGTKAETSFGFSVMPLVWSGTPEPGERRASGRVEGVAAMAVVRF
jgi:hypothetical protein